MPGLDAQASSSRHEARKLPITVPKWKPFGYRRGRVWTSTGEFWVSLLLKQAYGSKPHPDIAATPGHSSESPTETGADPGDPGYLYC
jgi:hypothetical protein